MVEWESKTEAATDEFVTIGKRIRAIGDPLVKLCGGEKNVLFSPNRWNGDFKAWEYPRVFKWLKQSGAKTVMDFGCGFSPFAQFLSENGFEVWGVDNDSDGHIASVGLNNMKRVYPDVKYHIGEIFDIDDKFDAIVSCSVLEHIGSNGQCDGVYRKMNEICDRVCHVVDYYFPEKKGSCLHRLNFKLLASRFGIPFNRFAHQEVLDSVDFMFPNRLESRILFANDV